MNNNVVEIMQDDEINILRELYYHKCESGTMVVPYLTPFSANTKKVCENLSNKGLIDFVADGYVRITSWGEDFLLQEGIVRS